MSSLVSIIVITYNSSEFVFETLESAKGQTYDNLELIISDDGSSDRTVEICNNWLEENKSRFVRAKIITVDENTGIPANFNRGILAANGIWIKPVAGDDALLPGCIMDNMNHIVNHPHVKVLYSYNKVYKNTFEESNFIGLNPSSYPANMITENITSEEQYKILLTGNRISFTPTLFFEKEARIIAGLPDEDLFSEDYQSVLKFTKKGYKLNFMNKTTMLYRKHFSSINNTTEEYILKPHYFKTENFRIRYIYPNIPKGLRLFHQYRWIVNQVFRSRYFNRKNKLNYFIYYFLNVIINPFKYLLYIKSHFIKKYKNDIFYHQ